MRRTMQPPAERAELSMHCLAFTLTRVWCGSMPLRDASCAAHGARNRHHAAVSAALKQAHISAHTTSYATDMPHRCGDLLPCARRGADAGAQHVQREHQRPLRALLRPHRRPRLLA